MGRNHLFCLCCMDLHGHRSHSSLDKDNTQFFGTHVQFIQKTKSGRTFACGLVIIRWCLLWPLGWIAHRFSLCAQNPTIWIIFRLPGKLEDQNLLPFVGESTNGIQPKTFCSELTQWDANALKSESSGLFCSRLHTAHGLLFSGSDIWHLDAATFLWLHATSSTCLSFDCLTSFSEDIENTRLGCASQIEIETRRKRSGIWGGGGG